MESGWHSEARSFVKKSAHPLFGPLDRASLLEGIRETRRERKSQGKNLKSDRDFLATQRVYLNMEGIEEAACRVGSDIEERVFHSMEFLYERHLPDAQRLAFLLTNDVAAAEDLAQEAFVRLIGRFTDFRRPNHFGGYLYRTIINLARGRHRRQLVEDRFIRREREEIQNHEPDHSTALAQRDPLWRALLKLPPKQRSVLFLRYYADLTEPATADVLDCSLSAVKSLTLRATRNLRKQMEGDEDG